MKTARRRAASGAVQDSSPNRRLFLQALVSSLGLPLLAGAAPAAESIEQALLTSRSKVDLEPDFVPTDSEVGSLFPFIQSQAKREFPLSFLNPEYRDLESWKKLGRGKVLELLHYSPPRCLARPEITERVDMGEYIREKLYFNTTPDIRAPAYLLVPKNARWPAPGIVALHDHGAFYLWGKEKLVETAEEHPYLTEFKQGAYSGKSIASELARQGYVVLVIDMFYWGERRMLLDSDPAVWRRPEKTIPRERIDAFNRRSSENEQLVGRTIYSAGFTWAGVMFWDDIRSVDYLVSRPEVDRKRIGCVGLSVGGLRSCHLAALDSRIKAAVAVGWMCSFPYQLKNRIRHTIGFTKLVPGLYSYMDYPDVASLAAPAALLVINGSKDGLFEPEGVRKAFDKLKACYSKAGALEKVRVRLYDTSHEFNQEMQNEAWAWLKQWL